MNIKKQSGGAKHHAENKRSLASVRNRRKEFGPQVPKAPEKFTDAERAQGYKGRLMPRGGFTR